MVAVFPMSSTREIYGKTLVELGREDPNVVVLGGDLNKSTFTHLFGAQFPNRFFDFGPAEQNIMGNRRGPGLLGQDTLRQHFCRLRYRPPLRPDKSEHLPTPPECKNRLYPRWHSNR